jgi:hypothetical protein
VDQVKLKNMRFCEVEGYDETTCLHEDDPEVQALMERLRRDRFTVPILLPRLYRPQYHRRGCAMPFRALPLDGDGFTGPCCCRGMSTRHDNFFRHPDVWNGETIAEARRELLDTSRPLSTVCMHCEEMIQDRPTIGG